MVNLMLHMLNWLGIVCYEKAITYNVQLFIFSWHTVLDYKERVREVEHASFFPFLLPCTGDAGPSATTVTLKRLAAMLAEK